MSDANDIVGRWVLFPWFGGDRSDDVHPEDLQATRELMPYCKPFYAKALEGDYIRIARGSSEIRVRAERLEPIPGEPHRLGEQVRLHDGRDAVIVDALWHYKRSAPFYHVRLEGKRKSKRYWDSDFMSSRGKALPESARSQDPHGGPSGGIDVAVVTGDLLAQDVEVIVNAWNRNMIPWWLLIPQGVAGAIRRRAGAAPFRELSRHGTIPLGGAVLTSAGRLPFRGIIHVAGISMLWRSSERSIRGSVRSALKVARENNFHSIALPLIGAGTGGGDEDRVLALIRDELGGAAFDGRVIVVRYPTPQGRR
jgi:O-acetyl-ADP-ribose deacetylase (regulator of RNase III)